MAEQAKRGRKPSKPNTELVIAAIERGDYDEELSNLQVAITVRNEFRKQQVLDQVAEVFGADYEVKPIPKPRVGPQNPFLERAAKGIEVSEEPQSERPTGDPLSHLDEVEQSMEQNPSFERRGATISGLHPSDIAD